MADQPGPARPAVAADPRGSARRAIALVDLTTLTGDEDDATIAALCARAMTPAGPVAAVCVHPDRVAPARAALGAGGPVRIAAVANFPEGDLDADRARSDAVAAVAAGAEEIDVVLPWRAWLAGDHDAALAVIRAVRAEAPVLKVILEAGALGAPATVAAAARAALAEGADFVKTSTGKRSPGATPEAARAMLEAVRDHGAGGFKASGGLRTTEDAAAYLAIADELLGPGWATPATFRLGASTLLDDLLRHAG